MQLLNEPNPPDNQSLEATGDFSILPQVAMNRGKEVMGGIHETNGDFPLRCSKCGGRVEIYSRYYAGCKRCFAVYQPQSNRKTRQPPLIERRAISFVAFVVSVPIVGIILTRTGEKDTSGWLGAALIVSIIVSYFVN